MKNTIITVLFLLSAVIAKAYNVHQDTTMKCNYVNVTPFVWEIKMPQVTRLCVSYVSFDNYYDRATFVIEAKAEIVIDSETTNFLTIKQIPFTLYGEDYTNFKEITSNDDKMKYLIDLFKSDYDSIIIIN